MPTARCAHDRAVHRVRDGTATGVGVVSGRVQRMRRLAREEFHAGKLDPGARLQAWAEDHDRRAGLRLDQDVGQHSGTLVPLCSAQTRVRVLRSARVAVLRVQQAVATAQFDYVRALEIGLQIQALEVEWSL